MISKTTYKCKRCGEECFNKDTILSLPFHKKKGTVKKACYCKEVIPIVWFRADEIKKEFDTLLKLTIPIEYKKEKRRYL